jgi:phosphate transport system protein
MAPALRRAFRHGLDDLRIQVELMGAKVEAGLDLMFEVLRTGDEQLARQAVRADDDIDATNLSLTERCYEMLTLEAPVAGDLRLVVSVIRVASELERVGDLSLRVVLLAPHHADLRAEPLVFDLLVVMADRAREEFAAGMGTWAAMDAAQAAEVLERPSATGHLSRRLATHLVTLRGPQAASIAVRATVAAQALDRIADHGRVIAARTRYLVTGDPAHLAAEIR